jgi:acyl-CoA synthetase (NDP forming)
LVQDFPHAQINDTEQLYLNDTKAFIDECKLVGLTPIICSTLPENINERVGNKILKLGGVPMQGIHNCLKAVKHLLDYNNFSCKKELQKFKLAQYENNRFIYTNEYQGKISIRAYGIKVPRAQPVEKIKDLEKIKIKFPIALKFTSLKILHKTEFGAVKLNINSLTELKSKYQEIKKSLGSKMINNGTFFIEEMLPTPIAEMFLSIRSDKTFGNVLVVGMGGALTELYRDTKTFILPVSKKYISEEMKKMKFFNLINGFRNNNKAKLNVIINEIFKLVDFHSQEENGCSSIEINPFFIYEDKIIAADCVLAQKI